VFLGDDSITRIVGRGRLRLTLEDGMKITLHGVLHMLDHVVIDANGLIIWAIVGSYVIDVNSLV
jgi:hypothetical protein